MSTITVDSSTLTVFLLVLARAVGWVVVTPLFGTRGFTVVGRAMISLGLALVLTVPAGQYAQVPNDLGTFVVNAIIQFAFGAGFGLLTGLFLYAPAAAGATADLLSGLGYAAVVDPASGQQAAVFSRFFSITFLALLFATGAYAVIISGFARTFEVIPVGAEVPFNESASLIVASAVTGLLQAAVEVGAPLLGVLLLTEVVLGAAARFFPQANVTFLGLGLKGLVALIAASAVLILLPGRMDTFIDSGQRLAEAVFA